MSTVSHRPGPLAVRSGPDLLLLIDDPSSVDGFCDLARGAASVLDALLAAGIDRLPRFALVIQEAESVRVLVRGELVVEVDGADPDVLSGAGYLTWHEARFFDVERVSVRERALAAGDVVSGLPADGGVAEVRWNPGGGAEPDVIAVITPGVLRGDGVEVLLDAPLLLGREFPGEDYLAQTGARWCEVKGRRADVSRVHARLEVDGPQVSVVDLDSTNGTAVVGVDGVAVTLTPHVPVPLPVGAVLVLAECVSLRHDPA